jgi:protein O-mannosyl-transferase
MKNMTFMPASNMKNFLLKYSGEPQTKFLMIMIGLAVFACYLPTLNNGFVWDDTVSFIENKDYRGLSLSHLNWMFTTFYDANYHPLTWLSLGCDFTLWGMNPMGYHLTNLVLHVLNAIIFYFLVLSFLRLFPIATDKNENGFRIGAVAGALFFAIHPLRVETVSWISTRGDLLCGVFYLLTLITYMKIETGSIKRKWFVLSLLFYLLSLLSRAWGITLPVVLLILDAYPLKRIRLTKGSGAAVKKILLEKIPFVFFALGGSVLALMAKKSSMLPVVQHNMGDRMMQAAYGLSFYLIKTAAPFRLSPFYLLDKSFDPLAPKYFLSALVVFGITAGLTMLRRKIPWALTAWICYAVIVSPLLGFVQSGDQITADRYTYISAMPFAILIGGCAFKIWSYWKNKVVSSYVWYAAVAGNMVWLLFMSYLSMSQIGIWKDNRTLLDHILKLDPGNYISYYDRGLLRERQGDLTGAISDYNSVIRLDAENAKAYNNRGVLLKIRGKLSDAMADFNTAIRLKPCSPEAYANRGIIYLIRNERSSAVRDLKKALQVASDTWPNKGKVKKILADIVKQDSHRNSG